MSHPQTRIILLYKKRLDDKPTLAHPVRHCQHANHKPKAETKFY